MCVARPVVFWLLQVNSTFKPLMFSIKYGSQVDGIYAE